MAVVLLGLGLLGLQLRYAPVLAQTIGLAGFSFMTPLLTVALIAGGMVIGCAGGYIAARRVRTT